MLAVGSLRYDISTGYARPSKRTIIASSLATRSCLSHLDFLAGGGKSSEGCTPDEADVDDGGCTLKKLTNSSALIVAEEMIMRREGRIRRILGDAGSVTG
jgi:hypothetical protein